jgi:rhodanese-related sulfurtransferase
MTNQKQQVARARPRPLAWLFFCTLGCTLAPGLLGGCQRQQVSDRRIDVITLSQALEYHRRSEKPDPEVLFIDARRRAIASQGSIRGAVNLRPDDIDLRTGPDPRLESKEALIIYGQDPSSAVARAMSKRLIEAGYNTMLRRRVKFYAGGYNEWLESGLPIDEPAPGATTGDPDPHRGRDPDQDPDPDAGAASG